MKNTNWLKMVNHVMILMNVQTDIMAALLIAKTLHQDTSAFAQKDTLLILIWKHVLKTPANSKNPHTSVTTLALTSHMLDMYAAVTMDM
jgi:hypothetical protein